MFFSGGKFEPVIKLARDGVRVHPLMEIRIQQKFEEISASETLRTMLVSPETGRFIKTGDMWKQPLLAATLTEIAELGPVNSFYKGSIAKRLVADIQKNGGYLTLEDFASYEALVYTLVIFPHDHTHIMNSHEKLSNFPTTTKLSWLHRHPPPAQLWG